MTRLFRSSVTSAGATRGNAMMRRIWEWRKFALKRPKLVLLPEMKAVNTKLFLNSLDNIISDDGVLRRCDLTGNLHKQCLNDGDFCYCLVSFKSNVTLNFKLCSWQGDLCNSAINPAWSLSLLTVSLMLAHVMRTVFV